MFVFGSLPVFAPLLFGIEGPVERVSNALFQLWCVGFPTRLLGTARFSWFFVIRRRSLAKLLHVGRWVSQTLESVGP